MDRLTDKRLATCGYYVPKNKDERRELQASCPSYRELYVRLAAYEDTGLTPEEIHELQTAYKRDQWISVEERLPEEKTEVLISDNQFFGGPLAAVAYLDRGKWSWRDDMSTSALPRPTHWRPLPEPPKEET